MCGRFTLTLEASVLQQELDLGSIPSDWVPRYNIAPSQPVLAVRDLQNKNAEWIKWGLVPSWAKGPRVNAMINARGETVDEKPSFRKAFSARRCLILADGFFEWKRNDAKSSQKIAYYFKNSNDRPFAFAGIWERWHSPEGEIDTCAIITCSANSCMSGIHDRMPVMLNTEKCWHWLEDLPPIELKSMLAPYPPDQMVYHAVSRQVNSTKNDFPGILEKENI